MSGQEINKPDAGSMPVVTPRALHQAATDEKNNEVQRHLILLDIDI